MSAGWNRKRPGDPQSRLRNPMTTSETRGNLDASLRDGAAFSAMVGLGETYVPAFALAVGLGDVAAGLVSTVPFLAGAAVQLVTPHAVARLGSVRRWVVFCATVQALSFVPLVIGALAGGISTAWLYGTMIIYWGFGMSTGPAWNAWIETLVPRPLRAHFFGQRNRLNNAAVVCGLLIGGLALELGADAVGPLIGFASIFTLAGVARALSARWLARHTEPVLIARGLPARSLGLKGLRSSGGALLAFMVLVQLAVNVSGPFFTPFMLGTLRLSYTQFTILTALAFVARVVALPYLSRHAAVDARKLLVVGGVGIAPIAWLWTWSDSFAYLVVLQLYAGFVWAAYELATLLLFFDSIPRSERIRVLTLFNLANATALVLGSVLGGILLETFGSDLEAYKIVFDTSSVLRLIAAFWLLRLVGRMQPTAVHEVVERTISVRPAGGGAQPPVLPSLDP